MRSASCLSETERGPFTSMVVLLLLYEACSSLGKTTQLIGESLN